VTIWGIDSGRAIVLSFRMPSWRGSLRTGSIKRVASAVGEGSMSVRLVHQYLASQAALGRS
jgi:thioredoxin reductase (NADPH)